VPERQFLSFAAIAVLLDRGVLLHASQELLHILARPHISHVAQVLVPHLRPLERGRYLRRWARRLREEGLGSEDAVIVSYASFGVDVAGERFGSEAVLTTDYALVSRYQDRHARIHRRFHQMTCQLAEPYRRAVLPTLLAPEDLFHLL
jgi:hypothetical protein